MSGPVKLAAAGASLAALAGHPTLRNFIIKWSGVAAPGGIWRLLAILFALGNLKNLPFIWHLRFFRAFTYHLYLQPTPIPPSALFQPIVTSTRTPLLEMDYNLHKSNSTYFSDMDISRTHLFTAIIRNAIRKKSRLYGNKAATPSGAAPAKPAKHIIALGGITCLFKREVLPYAKFEMWTRILTWDRKWFYLVTHLVKPGVGKPSSYSLQPWKKGRQPRTPETEEEREKLRAGLKGAVYATALAKYVIKQGRLTIAPEKALIDADMVPEKPEGWVYKGGAEHMNGNGHANGHTVEDAVLPDAIPGEAEWNWDVIETERLRGLKLAENFAALEGLHDVWDGGEKGVLGEYADFLFA